MRRFRAGIIAGSFVASVMAAAVLSTSAAALQRQRGSTPEGTHVDVLDFRFDESELSIGRGKTVIFDFLGPSHHTATDGTGMDLYDSGSVGAGEPSTWFTFDAAGTYRFVCTPHVMEGMVGRISVPMRVVPAQGGVHHTFTVVWSAVAAPSGYIYDVQIRRPGKTWTSWRTASTQRQHTFTPNAGKGTYRFRARMRGLNDGRTLWSAPSAIRVD